MNPKESYYAALERQRAGESTLRDRFERSPKNEQHESEALDVFYTEIGMKAFTAFNSCLDWISRLGSRPSSAVTAEALEEAMRRTLGGHLEELRREYAQIKERLERFETGIAAIEAGLRRIDKFTLEAFRNVQELEERVMSAPPVARPDQHDAAYRGRLAKEEAARLAIDAAHAMRSQGRRLTLAAVAREAGLKYGQIVYAFGNKEGFFNALKEVEGERLEMQLDAGA